MVDSETRENKSNNLRKLKQSTMILENFFIYSTLQEYIEYEYVNTPSQISKTFIIKPLVNINEAYQYIVANFYFLNG